MEFALNTALLPARLLQFPALDAASQLRHHRPMETRCSQCGAPMTCQPEGGCWCAELPHCAPMPNAASAGGAEGCLCRYCLLAKIDALQKVNQEQKA